MAMKAEQRLAKIREQGAKRLTDKQVYNGDRLITQGVYPTGSLMLDYKTGIGGFPDNHAVEVFGANKLGKSSAVLYPLLGNVQKQGKVPALIMSEPRMSNLRDREWARKLGFEPDDAYIVYPKHADEAFNELRALIFGGLVDYVAIDSLGAIGTATGAKEDGKVKAYGISGAVTSALNDVMQTAFLSDIGLCIVNQQRQSGSYNGTILYDSPGGEGLHHHMRMRIQVKPSERYTAKVDGETVTVGRELTCKFVKNSLSEGDERSASFKFYNISSSLGPIGIDKGNDIINVGKLTGVIQGSGWYEHPSFPANKKGERKLQGAQGVAKYLAENPEAMEHVRSDVMTVMEEQERLAAERARLAALEASVEAEQETEDE
jgi:RecA/RadA recombinase